MNRVKVLELCKEGKGYEEIAKVVGISRQRVHQICTGYRSPYHFSENYKSLRKQRLQGRN
jgi:transcriptional regulator